MLPPLSMFDLILRNGRVVDGTGNPWYRGDVAVKDGRIAAVGRLEPDAVKVIDAEGLVISPGFIDTHSHSDLMLMVEPHARQKIMQGVTTEIVGQDGLGEAPLRDDVVDEWRKYLSGLNGDPPIDWDWRSLSEYLDRLEAAKPSINVATLVGHGNVRLLAVGMENRKPTQGELEEMRELVASAMEDGAYGMSTGLIYPPCVYADTSELTELCKVVAEQGGVFVVHMRNEGNRLMESIDEMVEVARGSGVPLHISHFKANGRPNWGKAPLAVAKVEETRRDGLDVTVDQYPYVAGSTFLGSLIPSWAHEGGIEKLLERLRDRDTRTRILRQLLEEGDEGDRLRWEGIMITNVATSKNKPFEGRRLAEAADLRGQEPAEALLDIVLEEENAATMVSFTMHEDDVRTIMRAPFQMVCTDGIVLGRPHPRAYGSFPRVVGRYVREGVLRLEEAVRKMTSAPAQRFGLLNRGILRPGFAADITVFDPDRVIDTATYEDPIKFPEGIEYVIVGGEVTVENGKHTGERNGRIFRHRQLNQPS